MILCKLHLHSWKYIHHEYYRKCSRCDKIEVEKGGFGWEETGAITVDKFNQVLVDKEKDC